MGVKMKRFALVHALNQAYNLTEVIKSVFMYVLTIYLLTLKAPYQHKQINIKIRQNISDNRLQQPA